MSIKIIEQRFKEYACSSRQEEENALAEISQEIALAGLSRAGFFKEAVFQGGTALRILYGMQRFSEDLDFILKEPGPSFRLAIYLKSIELEFCAYGIELMVQDRSKADETVKKAFLKSDSIGKVLMLRHGKTDGRMKSVKIKLEVDTRPPAGNGYETKYLDFPLSFPVTAQDFPSLFAGKSHALLCREYTKGRDWFDFAWYSGRKSGINFAFLSGAIDQAGPWQGEGVDVTKDWYIKEMGKKIAKTDWDEARKDVARFLKPADVLAIEGWSRGFFMDRLKKIAEHLK